MKTFQYAGMPKVCFGEGSLKTALEKEMPLYGENILVAYGGGSIKRNGIYDEVVTLLKSLGKKVFDFSGIMANPTYDKVQEGARLVRENNIDFILAVGGGSTIDCCKIVSAQAKTDEDIWTMEFSEGKFPTEFIPMGAVTTVSGTGAEMNNGAVITHEEYKLKNGVWGALSDFCVLDPSYTLKVPMKQVISGAFDTLSHCMETYFGSPLENNVSDEINEAIMRNTIRNIRAVIKEPQDVSIRSELMWTSSMAENGILKLGKVTDFQCHMLEHQLGAYTNCNHGQGLAILHPSLYRHMYKDGLKKFVRFAKEVWHVCDDGLTEEEVALQGIDALERFIKEIGLPTSLTEIGINDINMLKKAAETTRLTPGCCHKFDAQELYFVLLQCLR